MSSVWGRVCVGEHQPPLKVWLLPMVRWLRILCIVQPEKMQDLLIGPLLLCLCASVRCVSVLTSCKCLHDAIQLFSVNTNVESFIVLSGGLKEKEIAYPCAILLRTTISNSSHLHSLNDIVIFAGECNLAPVGIKAIAHFSWDMMHISSMD